MERINENELKGVLHSFQKDKSLSLDRWSIEFYLDFYDIISKYLPKVVEESKLTSFIHLSINSTFISLIPKLDHPVSFEEYKPISLCNCLYKIISKIIAKRFKAVLSRNISLKQFGFLEGQQIHEAIGVA